MPKRIKTYDELDSRLLMQGLLERNGNMPIARMSRHIKELTGQDIHRNQLMRLRDNTVPMMHRTVMTLITYKQQLDKKKKEAEDAAP
jgi:hypothetical protein